MVFSTDRCLLWFLLFLQVFALVLYVSFLHNDNGQSLRTADAIVFFNIASDLALDNFSILLLTSEQRVNSLNPFLSW